MRLFVLLIGLFVLTSATRLRRNRHWRPLRPNCGSLDSLIRGYPPYVTSELSAAPRLPEMFPFSLFARRPFRGFGVLGEVLERRMGRPCEGPLVEPLTLGTFELRNETLRVSAGTTLITDQRTETGEIFFILVDTGSSTQRMSLLAALSSVGVMPQYINNVVLTHMDLDSMGNLNLFPEAGVFVGNRRAERDLVYFPKVGPSFDQTKSGLPFTRLSENTYLYFTPGFTNDDVSLVIQNVSGIGTVAVVGNLIVDENDAKSGESLRRFAQSTEHSTLWETSRKEILCLSDLVVPGYGSSFPVTNEIKNDCSEKNQTISAFR